MSPPLREPLTPDGGPLICIAGPTAVGKTAVAIALARRLGGEVISADAMMVYRGLEIGTDKPTIEERAGVTHHLIDVVDPGEAFSAARYRDLARAALAGVLKRGHVAIVCGGTGLYFRAFVDDVLPRHRTHDPGVRAAIEARADREGLERAYRLLESVDPAAARRIHPNDRRRIVRALEVCETTGMTMSDVQREARRSACSLPAVWFGLTRPREVLYRRIEERVDRQVALGLVDETRRLLEAGIGPDRTAMQALGYKEMASYLSGRASPARAVAELKRRTRHYAKRQWTWFRADPRVRWVELAEESTPVETAARLAGLYEQARGEMARPGPAG